MGIVESRLDWPQIRIRDWSEFAHLAQSFTSAGKGLLPTHLYRGQADDSWLLKPSLMRNLPANVTSGNAIELEKLLLSQFQSRAQLHIAQVQIPDKKSDVLDWWVLMQHCGAPTRLLDWAASAYVAAYFAVEQCSERDGVVWIFHTFTVAANPPMDVASETQQTILFDPKAPSELVTFQSTAQTERMVAQQGHFIVSTQVLGDLSELIMNKIDPAKNKKDMLARKLVIPKDLKPDFLIHLKAMNITASALFPGMDGLGRSIEEMARMAGNYLAKEHP